MTVNSWMHMSGDRQVDGGHKTAAQFLYSVSGAQVWDVAATVVTSEATSHPATVKIFMESCNQVFIRS